MWHEALANRGGNEIASCIFEHLSNLPLNIDHVIYYSDNCPGQNKNSFLAYMFLTYLQSSPTIKTIDHKFLISGHTHMECDSAHAQIEKEKKKTTMRLHHPRDWMQFIQNLGKKQRFNVTEMKQEMFLDFGTLSRKKLIFRKKKNDSDCYFSWNRVRWIRYTKELGKIFYKNSFDETESFKELNVLKKDFNEMKISELSECYDGPLKINTKKKADLMSLLDFIDEEYKEFYEKLEADSKIPNIHPDYELIENNENE